MSSMKRIALALSLIIALSFSALAGTGYHGTVQAATNVTGIIASDTHWTKANSPYTFTGPVAVDNGVTLTIEPGVMVNVGDYYLQVNGTLRASGSDSEKIQFNGNSRIEFRGTAGFVHYGYVAFYGSSVSYNQQSGSGCLVENTVFNCDIILNAASPKLSKVTFLTVDVNGGTPTFSDCDISEGMGVYGSSSTIANCTISGYSSYHGFAYSRPRTENTLVVSGSPNIAHNEIKGPVLLFDGVSVIVGNTLGRLTIESGSGLVTGNKINGSVEIEGGTATVEKNLIQSSAIGLKVASQAVVQHNTIRDCETAIVASKQATIVNNNFEGFKHSVNLTSSADFNVAYNWWGTTDNQAISQSIYDFEDDFNLGKVTFTPFLTSPDPNATPDPNTPTPTPEQTPATSPAPTQPSTSTPDQEPILTPEQSQAILGAAVVIVVIGAGLGLLIYLIKRK